MTSSITTIGCWQHHPDCEYWFDQYPNECTCGLTARPVWSKLEKWTRAQWNDWIESIREDTHG